MEHLVLGILAFVAVTLIGAGFFGRPDQSKPTCRRCKRDAREFAWDGPPMCACGARLDRPGAVRTRGRIRKRKLIAIGLSLGLANSALLAWTISLSNRHLRWPDALPLFVVRQGFENVDGWAIDSLRRRIKAGKIDAAAAAELLSALDVSGGLAALTLTDLRLQLAQAWLQQPIDVDAVLPNIANLKVVNATHLKEPSPETRDPGLVSIAVRMTPLVDPGAWFTRVDRIEVEGKDVPFTLSTVPIATTNGVLLLGEYTPASALGRRVIVGDGACDVLLPAPALGTTATFTLHLTVVRSLAAPAAPRDSIIDSDAAPEAWGVSGIAARVERSLNIAIPAAGARHP